jgi:hypothetical protein
MGSHINWKYPRVKHQSLHCENILHCVFPITVLDISLSNQATVVSPKFLPAIVWDEANQGILCFNYSSNLTLIGNLTLLVLYFAHPQSKCCGFQILSSHVENSEWISIASFLKKLKKILAAISVRYSLLLRLYVEGCELMLYLERVHDRVYRAVIIQTDAKMGLLNHAVSTSEAFPQISYRTCMVLENF